MIVFDLVCANAHEFEAWFAGSDAYEKQRKAKKVACPVCGDVKVSKALMAPAVSGTKKKSGDAPPDGKKAVMSAGAAEFMQALRGLRRHVEENCDYVGERFPEEARKMHYGEADKRNIYGEASAEEAEALKDEGVEVAQVPWVPDTDA
jgi:hypothetical protein